MRARKSAVEQRRAEIDRHLTRLRADLARKSPEDFTTEFRHRSWLEGTHWLIAMLLEELSALNDPGEYDGLPAAVVADELGLGCDQVRGLIRLGEITATGKAAHERVGRAELGRITALGPAELLRLGRQESAEIFEQAVPLLQGEDLVAAERAYRRLEGRESWAAPYAPAFLVGLELARGDLAGALLSMKLICGSEDLLQRVTVLTYLGRVLPGVRLREAGARELCTRLIALAEEVIAAGRGRPGARRLRQPEAKDPGSVRRQAANLTAAVVCGLREHGLLDRQPAPDGPDDATGGRFGHEVVRVVRDALYAALDAEAFY